MSEKAFQRRLAKALRERGAMVLVTIGNLYQRGFPDMYVAHKKWTGWLELKFHSGRLRKEQVFALRELRRRGVQAYVCRQTEHGFTLENEDHSWVRRFDTLTDVWAWLTDQE